MVKKKNNNHTSKKTLLFKPLLAVALLLLSTLILSSFATKPVLAKEKCQDILGYAQFCYDDSKKTCSARIVKHPSSASEQQAFTQAYSRAQSMCNSYKAKVKQQEEAKKKTEEAKKKTEEASKKNNSGSSSGTSTGSKTTTGDDSSGSDSSSTSICDNPNVSSAVKSAAGCDENGGTLNNALTTILKGIILILGVVAVIFIVVGGVNYMTSAGDANKIKKAKDTILYAVIGLIICALSFMIVNFVIEGLLTEKTEETQTTETEAYQNTLIQNDIAILKK